LDGQFSEAAWSGYAFNTHLPERKLFHHLKSDLLAAIAQAERLAWEPRYLDKLVQYLIVATVFRQGRRQLVRFGEARDCLRRTNEFGRTAAVRYMRHGKKGGEAWEKFGRRFVEKVWPKELSTRTGQSSRILAEMAVDADERAPNAVKTILPLLGPGDHLDTFVHRICPPNSQEKTSFASRFPIEAIELIDRLLGETTNRLPHGFERLLNVIGEGPISISQSPTFQRLRALAAATR
jgi:hypothetical protein